MEIESEFDGLRISPPPGSVDAFNSRQFFHRQSTLNRSTGGGSFTPGDLDSFNNNNIDKHRRRQRVAQFFEGISKCCGGNDDRNASESPLDELTGLNPNLSGDIKIKPQQFLDGRFIGSTTDHYKLHQQIKPQNRIIIEEAATPERISYSSEGINEEGSGFGEIVQISSASTSELPDQSSSLPFYGPSLPSGTARSFTLNVSEEVVTHLEANENKNSDIHKESSF